MANYNSLKNAGMLKPVANTDLGSPTNTYGNLYMSGNISLNGTSLNSTNAIAPRIASITYLGNDTAAAPAGGATITLTGSGFVTGAAVYVGGTIATPVTVISSTQITFVAPAKTTGNYSLNVVNTDGAAATFIPGMQYSGVPTWSTSAGSLGSVTQATSVNFTVAATSDTTVSYSVTSGSLPSGVSLNTSSGAITGTAPSVGSNTTYSFTIRATDSENQDTDRNFSMTVNAITPPSTVEYLVVAGGGGTSGPYYAGGGGGGGFLTNTNYAISVGTPITVTVGAGGGVNTGAGGSDSSFGTITATGGGAGKTYNSSPGGDGGSGGGHGSYSGSGSNETSQQYLGGTGIVGQGNNGGSYIGFKAYYNDWLGSGGGGGAGAAGSAGTKVNTGSSYPTPNIIGGAGGAGLASSISGTATYYAGGGGGSGSGQGPTDNGGAGGVGGGGKGAGNGGSTIQYGSNGEVNTGGGGGGDYAGGSGIVIIRYADTYGSAVATTGSPTVTVAGGYRVYKFTSSGSITF